ncbi:unnamed protein product [Malus baccata var. baccata]
MAHNLQLVENCGCDQEDKDVSWFMVNKLFGDDSNMLPEEGVKGLGLALPDNEDGPGDESRVGPKDDDRTVTDVVDVPPRKRRRDPSVTLQVVVMS